MDRRARTIRRRAWLVLWLWALVLPTTLLVHHWCHEHECTTEVEHCALAAAFHGAQTPVPVAVEAPLVAVASATPLPEPIRALAPHRTASPRAPPGCPSS